MYSWGGEGLHAEASFHTLTTRRIPDPSTSSLLNGVTIQSRRVWGEAGGAISQLGGSGHKVCVKGRPLTALRRKRASASEAQRLTEETASIYRTRDTERRTRHREPF